MITSPSTMIKRLLDDGNHNIRKLRLRCDKDTTFVATNGWFRDHYKCSACGSIPRERALMCCVKILPALAHESSPCLCGASVKLKKHARTYIPFQYYPDIKHGTIHNGVRCGNLENLMFKDESIDLHITQDVMEHIFNPEKAFRELQGPCVLVECNIFTVPLINKNKPTEECARIGPDGNIIHLCEPEYHGNPVSKQGSLVTRKWGYDKEN